MRIAILSILVLVGTSTALAGNYGINPPVTGAPNAGRVGVNPPETDTVRGRPGIGNFQNAQVQVGKLMELAGDDLQDIKEALIKIAQRETKTTKAFAEWNEYYRSKEFMSLSKKEKSHYMIAMKVALKEIVIAGTGKEFWD